MRQRQYASCANGGSGYAVSRFLADLLIVKAMGTRSVCAKAGTPSSSVMFCPLPSIVTPKTCSLHCNLHLGGFLLVLCSYNFAREVHGV